MDEFELDDLWVADVVSALEDVSTNSKCTFK